MSYSIGPFRGATKSEVMTALAQAFDAQVLPGQPVHSHDRDAHLSNVRNQLAVLPDDPGEGHEFSASMNGWLQYSGGGTATPYTIHGGGFGGSASIVPKASA